LHARSLQRSGFSERIQTDPRRRHNITVTRAVKQILVRCS
jgi:hypothetical protein